MGVRLCCAENNLPDDQWMRADQAIQDFKEKLEQLREERRLRESTQSDIISDVFESNNDSTVNSNASIDGYRFDLEEAEILTCSQTNGSQLDPEETRRCESEFSGGRLPSESSMDNECIICFERAQNSCLTPCQHHEFCDVCAFQLSNCPLCREPIEGITYTRASTMFEGVGTGKVVFHYVGHRIVDSDLSERRRYYLDQVYPDF